MLSKEKTAENGVWELAKPVKRLDASNLLVDCSTFQCRSALHQQTLTITDLTIGRTQADLINLLGMGHLIQAALRWQRGTQLTAVSSTVSMDEDDEDDKGDDSEDSEEEFNDSSQHPQLPRYKTKDIEGFGAAVCSLAVGVKVETKVSLEVKEEEQNRQTPFRMNFFSLIFSR